MFDVHFDDPEELMVECREWSINYEGISYVLMVLIVNHNKCFQLGFGASTVMVSLRRHDKQAGRRPVLCKAIYKCIDVKSLFNCII